MASLTDLEKALKAAEAAEKKASTLQRRLAVEKLRKMIRAKRRANKER